MEKHLNGNYFKSKEKLERQHTKFFNICLIIITISFIVCYLITFVFEHSYFLYRVFEIFKNIGLSTIIIVILSFFIYKYKDNKISP